MATRIFRVGLTGGLASGKSTVRVEFEAAGIDTIDSDALARRALQPPSPLIDEVARLFGDSVRRPDGTVNRERIAALAFADADLRLQLEAIVHPAVLRAEDEEVQRLEAQDSSMVVIDLPLLYEVGLQDRFDRVVVVACLVETQLARAVARGMRESDARARIAAQIPIDEKRTKADYVIDTEGSLEDTRAQARAILTALLAEASNNPI